MENYLAILKIIFLKNYCEVLVAQACPTLCNPMDYSPPGSSVHGILQARKLKWIAMPSSRGSSQPRDWTRVSCPARRFFNVWATRKAHEYWNRLPCPPPEDLPNPGIEWGSPALQADSLPAELPGTPKLCVKEYSLSPQVFVECGFFVCLFVCFFLGRVCILETQWAKY